MQFSIKKYGGIVLTILITLIGSSCSKDLDDLNRYNIEGQWRLEGVYKYDLEKNLINLEYYDKVWKVDKDSIEYTNTYILGEDLGIGVLSAKFSYRIYPDGTFYHSQQIYTIQVLTEDQLIYSIRRPDYIVEYHFFSLTNLRSF